MIVAAKPRYDIDKQVIHLVLEDEDGNETEATLPGKPEVCSRCNGKGRHVNPSIDGHGITQDEWENEWSYEEQEMYLSGGYDITCDECKGLRVVLVPNELVIQTDEKLKELYKLYNDYWEDMYAMQREYESERRMGA